MLIGNKIIIIYAIICSSVVCIYNANVYKCDSRKISNDSKEEYISIEDLKERLALYEKDEIRLMKLSTIDASYVSAEIFKTKMMIKSKMKYCDEDIFKYLYDNSVIGAKKKLID